MPARLWAQPLVVVVAGALAALSTSSVAPSSPNMALAASVGAMPPVTKLRRCALAARCMKVAGEWVRRLLKSGVCDDDVKQRITNKLIELASDGERNPDVLCERALKLIRVEPA